MALPTTKDAAQQFSGFTNLTALRQLALMVGLATSIAIGVYVAFWSQKPDFSLLYSNLSEKDMALIVEALQKSMIKYKIGAGNIMIPSDKVHDLRLQLAAQGLPKGAAVGFESLDESQGFGISQFMEKARYHRALEVELGRSIMTLNNVQHARVHLAIPKHSVFLRNKQKPSASVLVNLYSGRSIDPGQVSAITYLVSSSVPNLEAEQVTVVDHNGHLLTDKHQSDDMAITAAQFDYNRKLEKSYKERIENIIAPIVGVNSVHAQVTVETDFTYSEKTQELFNPDTPALRSNQIEEKSSSTQQGGIPGALSNQPSETPTVPQTASEGESKNTSKPSNNQRRTIQNYELDKTISHTRMGIGRLQRLSVAVVIDDKISFQKDAEPIKSSYSPEEIQRLTGLIKKAVGFDAIRGDNVSVINVPFSSPVPMEVLPEPGFWEQGWFQNLIKNVVVGTIILGLLLGVLRPVLRNLAQISKVQQLKLIEGSQDPEKLAEEQIKLQVENAKKLAPPNDGLVTVKTAVNQDPKLAAQVVKSWVAADG